MVEFGSSDLTVEDLREMYRLMLMGRRFTERTLELYEEGRLKPYHPSAGQDQPHIRAQADLFGCPRGRTGRWTASPSASPSASRRPVASLRPD